VQACDGVVSCGEAKTTVRPEYSVWVGAKGAV
jgi:hypothetical protein